MYHVGNGLDMIPQILQGLKLAMKPKTWKYIQGNS